jgi:SNF2 family DNA or RNA helicase
VVGFEAGNILHGACNEMTKTQLIFSFFRHPAYGLSLEAYLVDLLDNGSFSYQYKRINYELISNYDYSFTENETKILKKIEDLSQKNIDKHFNPKKLKLEVFQEKLSKDKDQWRLLSSYFDKRVAYCLAHLKGKKAYWKDRISDHPSMIALNVLENPAQLIYFFSKTENGISYKLEMRYNGKQISLQKPSTEVICNEPAWIKHSENIYHFSDPTDGQKLIPFLKKDTVSIPDKLSEVYLSSFMLKASKKFDVRYEGFNVKETPENKSALLTIESDVNNNAVFQLSYFYDNLQITDAQANDVIVKLQKHDDQLQLIRFQRDINWEKGFENKLLDKNLVKLNPSWFVPNDLKNQKVDFDMLVTWLSDNKKLLIEENILVEATQTGKVYSTEVAKLETKNISENDDWFDIYILVIIEPFEIPFIKFKKNIQEKRKDFKLPNGRIFLLPDSWFVQYSDIFEIDESDENSLRIHKQHQGVLQGHPLLSGDLSPKIKETVLGLNAKPEYDIPTGLIGTLRDYQKKGYDWLCHLGEEKLGACLADDMGLGKTLQVIAVLQRIKEQVKTIKHKEVENSIELVQLNLFNIAQKFDDEVISPCNLVVMAPSLIHNWENELKKFAPQLKVYKYLGQRRNLVPESIDYYDVILTTYGIVRNDLNSLQKYTFEYIVLDESQLIKNSSSASFQSVKLLKGNRRVVLTGTPVENSLTDLWSQLTFLQPRLLGSFKAFKQEYVVPIEQQKDISKLEKLRKIIQPFILRRTKEEVAPELPDVTRTVHYCEMNAEQKDLYESEKSIYRNKILDVIESEGIDKSQIMILRGLMQLRKIAIHPILNNASYIGTSGKLEEILGRLTQIKEENRKVLIFSPFVKHLYLIREQLITSKTPYSFLAGEVLQQQRASVISEFDKHKGHRVFLIQLKTGGAGLNLTEADCVFLIDPWWNPAAEEQAIARAHRIGQSKHVFVWRFITKDTIEEKILKLQERKSRLAFDVIEHTNTFGKITEEDLKELFG